MGYDELYAAVASGGVTGVESATYRVLVDSARPNAQSRQLWLTLAIEGGPQADKEVEVSLYLPKDGDKPFARTMFVRKVAGFNLSKDVFDAMTRQEAAEGVAGALAVLAQAIVNRRIDADLFLRTEGDYAGTNELKGTKAVEEGTIPVPAVTDQPEEAAESAAVSAVADDEPF